MLSAVILAGGLGTRLKQIVPFLPKTLALIQGVPFLQLLLQQLENSSAISHVVLALGYQAEQIQQFLQKKSYSFSVTFSVESSPLGTGGALLLALEKISDQTLLVLNGDSFFDLPLLDFFTFHQTNHADITVACREVEDTSRYGAIEMDSFSKRILSFQEKSSISKPGWINAGLYLMERNLLSSFTHGVHSLEKDFFPYFLKKKILAYPHRGKFVDIGTPDSYNEAQDLLKPWIST